ncbi:acetyl/propionyl/methylcrotonyl-CoA carboxylase subunit alpha [Alteromonas sp. 1_MG-2023]|uniref:acetyl/propionyl/methylcrotonyl-CoA carboxylase subunit alpha n=1 Tax=Alteromonas sp. 1_MG-2023 TaxID=3062669 RepID=UPI0026E429BC|nr:acetyl/propionyl/methylcrotonyl-CoA carboxylase subunit alpha [Alteromonas sp. 1_MG-2023]MDO6567540.1 acetyl/propionyl/methylcrotonyl-CoA carboxylase subunit alpha [Alteromonas sp. 1_MG-2023]
MIKKLLIANRGEIACRVMRTAKAMGIQTVAVYSDADAKALHVLQADEAVHLGPAPSKDSYLRGTAIIEYAKKLGVDAIHPGYGFLSENAEFAKACTAHDIIFVGPPASAIEAMGSKSAAKKIMEAAGVPLVPGYHGDDQDEATLKQASDAMGYPVLLKAAAGGGGKGMRQVWKESEFSAALSAAKRESMASFGDEHMLVEKYLTRPRHVEIQVFCDTHGNGVYLFERDCSVQRRHQKVIEEAPAPNFPANIRQQMGGAALQAAKAINYVGAGTVEFLYDEDGSFYFMEMNTRLQVEHPVTEMITGEDLVRWQLDVAEGKPLPKNQSELTLTGHAFEARIYAEDPNNDFLPASGTLSLIKTPMLSAQGSASKVRIDTGVQQGDEISVYYDPMISKLVVWGENREAALKQLVSALKQYHIDGVTTNIDFLIDVASSEPFGNAELTTTFIDKHADSLFNKQSKSVTAELPAIALLTVLSRNQCIEKQSLLPSPWGVIAAWRPNMEYQESLTVLVNDKAHALRLIHKDASGDTRKQKGIALKVLTGSDSIEVAGHLEADKLITFVDGVRRSYHFSQNDGKFGLFGQDSHCHFKVVAPDIGDDDDNHTGASLDAPMNGTVVAHLVEVGVSVKKDAPLLIMEAMKMEHSIAAPCDGMVRGYFYQPGELVDGGSVLIDFDADSKGE